MEDMIRRRIKEGNFSDVLPPPPRKDGDADETGNYSTLKAFDNTCLNAC
jgi:U3 small nucleolar ribonucleoprotein component